MTNTGQSVKAWWFRHEGKHYAIPPHILDKWEDEYGEEFWRDNPELIPLNLARYEKSIEGVVFNIDGELMIYKNGEFVPYVEECEESDEGVEIYKG